MTLEEKYKIIVPAYIVHLRETSQLNCNELRFIVDKFLEQNPEYTPLKDTV